MNGIYSGSFDPITVGHFDVIERASKIVDKLYIVIFNNSEKKYMFDVLERMFMIEESTKHLKNVIIDVSSDSVANYVSKHDIQIIFRGVRNTIDFEYELTMAQTNKKIVENCETLLIPTKESFSSTSSSIVRELSKYKHSVKEYVTPISELFLKRKNNEIKIIQLTGPSGSGKSTIGKIIAENYDAYYIDLDKINHYIMNNDSEVINDIGKNFNVINCGKIDRKKLATIVFNDKEKLQLLENIVFPKIIDNVFNQIFNHMQSKYIVLEGITIDKTSLKNIVDIKLRIKTDKNTQVERIMRRDNISEQEAEDRLKNNVINSYNSNYILRNNSDDNYEILLDKVNEIMKNV